MIEVVISNDNSYISELPFHASFAADCGITNFSATKDTTLWKAIVIDVPGIYNIDSYDYVGDGVEVALG